MKQSAAILFFAYVFTGILLPGCRNNSLPPEGYTRWMATNQDRLSVRTNHSSLLVSLTYVPADWLALREVGSDNPSQLSKTRQEYAGLEYYRLRLALPGGQGDLLQFRAASPNEYYQRVEYFSFGMQQDIRLLAGTDTLPCRLFHFERNYGAAPYADFMLGFEEKTDNPFDRTLLYFDRVYSNRPLLLTIPAENIQRTPKLKI